ncbi:MAG: helix-turn-helix transcriptional regulator [Erysipelotrichaceae bacterium]|nr:helix-turn-helix transcriptional regulator [Erysipelotrichaceae bacterium]
MKLIKGEIIMFKDKLKELREKEGLSQYELADKIYVSRTTVSKWERGLGLPSDVNIAQLCKYFKIDEEELISYSELKNNFKEKNKRNKLFILTSAYLLLLIVAIFFSSADIYFYNCGPFDSFCLEPISIFGLLEKWFIIVLVIYISSGTVSLFLLFNFISFSYKKKTIIVIILFIVSLIIFAVTFMISLFISIDNNYRLFY